MPTGWRIQSNKQLGEYLVASELARRGWLVATFSGNVPEFDILATSPNGNAVPIQVKTMRKGNWHFKADKFVEIHFDGDKQILGKKKQNMVQNLVFVLLYAKEYGEDQFFILDWEELRDLVIENHAEWLRKHGGVRPKNPQSMHCGVMVEQLEKFKDRWEKIEEKLNPAKRDSDDYSNIYETA